MAQNSPNPDITVRGGIINVPHSTTPSRAPLHQPDTPPTKKHTQPRPDHILTEDDAVTKRPRGRPPKIATTQPAMATEEDPSAPPPDEPETDPPK